MWSHPFNLTFTSPAPAGAAGRRVADMFGITGRRSITMYDDLNFSIRPGQIFLVVGPSGAGKSQLLGLIRRRWPGSSELAPTGPAGAAGHGRCAVDMPNRGPLQTRMSMLSRCGLADAHAMIMPAKLLSGGQQHRLAMAEALLAASWRDRPTLVIADEFCSVLDDMTAHALCRQIRRLVSGSPIALVAASPREDIIPHLQPDKVIAKPLGEPVRVFDGRDLPHVADSADAWRIERGRIGDYHAMAPFHYLSRPPAAHKRVLVIRPPAPRLLSGPSLAAVLVVSPPVINLRARNIVTGGRYSTGDRRTAASRLNAEIECISRVIVHPAFRGLGLAVRLVKHAIATAQTPIVEAIAMMGTISPFFERAGMHAWPVKPEQCLTDLLAAAKAVGLSPRQVAEVAPVRRLLARGGKKAELLTRFISRAMRDILCAKARARLDDPLAEVCRRTARKYVYYTAATRKAPHGNAGT